MVFPGHFSKGCEQCKRRRVKCDETKPTCRRCDKYGRPCPGYTDQFQFRHKTPGTKKDIVVSQARSSSPSANHKSPDHDQDRESESSASPPTTSKASPATALSRRPRTSVHRNPPPSYEHIALSYFIRRFTSPNNANSLPGHLTFLPDLFNHQQDGILEVATACVAQVAAYNRFGTQSFLVMSYQTYGRALQMLQQIILSDDDSTDDRVISAVLLLCIFKDISGEGLGDPNEHASGLYHLILKRGIEQLVSRNGFELYLIALVRLNVYSFLHNDDSYLDPGGLAASLAPFDPLMRGMDIVSSTMRIRSALYKSTACYKASVQLWQPGKTAETADTLLQPDLDLVQRAFELLEDFDSWDGEAAKYWEETLQGRTLALALRERTYLEPETACILILLRSGRLAHLLTMLEYLECYRRAKVAANGLYSAKEDFEAWTDCVDTLSQLLRATIDDMLLCVPYALGDVDSDGNPASMPYDGAGALIIVHPIRLIPVCSYATDEQRAACNAVLSRINTTIGIRSAVTSGADVVYLPQLCGCKSMLGPTHTPGPEPGPMELEPSVYMAFDPIDQC